MANLLSKREHITDVNGGKFKSECTVNRSNLACKHCIIWQHEEQHKNGCILGCKNACNQLLLNNKEQPNNISLPLGFKMSCALNMSVFKAVFVL